MTGDKIRKVLSGYRSYLTSNYSQFEADSKHKHLLKMIPQIEEFIDQGRLEKAFRWLGFMQGAFWALGDYTISELKRHNMPALPRSGTLPNNA